MADPVHWLTEVKGQEYTFGCGQTLTSKTGMPAHVSGWFSDITCALCQTRTYTHQKITSWEELMKLIDLDDPGVVQKFHFAGKRYHFRWLVNGRLIYIYEHEDSFSAACAIPLHIEQESTYENAQARAREYIMRQMERFGEEYMAVGWQPKNPSLTKPKYKPKPIPTGPHCDICKKPEEGDCVEAPSDPNLLWCMTCFVKQSR